jgi:hypothetical protein
MKKIFLYTLILLSSIGCKSKQQDAEAVKPSTIEKADPAKDSASIHNVISSFYIWYNKNNTALMKFNLYDGIKQKDAPPYRINWQEVEKYQQFIRDSIPQLGEQFLSNQRHFFEQCDSAFKKDVKDEIPFGFDYDWYTQSQEDPSYLLEEMNKKSTEWKIQVVQDSAAVNAPNDLFITMKKEKGQWTIASIGTFLAGMGL